MALARDVNFSDYNTSPLIAKACEDLSKLSDFRGPKENGVVTPNTIFRANIQGDLTGYWVSQFLLLDFYFGANFVSQRMRTTVPGVDYLTGWADWLAVQNGADHAANIQRDATPRYIRNLRDMAEWVHVDALYQAYLHACLIMMGQGIRLDPGLPLSDSQTQLPFAQCGGPHILSLVTEVATRALKAVWYQKWFVHHRLRPEEYAGRVHNHHYGRCELSSSSRCTEFKGCSGGVQQARNLPSADGIPRRLSNASVHTEAVIRPSPAPASQFSKLSSTRPILSGIPWSRMPTARRSFLMRDRP